MEIMIRGRQHGKTTELLQRFLENPEETLVVCHNRMTADSLALQACAVQGRAKDVTLFKEMQKHFVSATELRNMPMMPTWMRQLMVDNLDLVLPILTRSFVTFVTATAVAT